MFGFNTCAAMISSDKNWDDRKSCSIIRNGPKVVCNFVTLCQCTKTIHDCNVASLSRTKVRNFIRWFNFYIWV